MDFSAFNWFAVIAASLVGFAIGFIWYGPMFGKTWMNAVGMTEEDAQNGNMGKIFGVSFLFQIVMAFFLAMFFFGDPETASMIDASSGAFYGFLTGFGWVAMSIGVNALYEQKSWAYIFINGGFWVVVYTLMGLILGAWR